MPDTYPPAPGAVVTFRAGQWRDECCGPLGFPMTVRVQSTRQAGAELEVIGVHLDPNKGNAEMGRVCIKIIPAVRR